MNVIEYKLNDVIIANVGVGDAPPNAARRVMSAARRAIKLTFPTNKVLVLAVRGGNGVNLTFARQV